jgi:hypothetical protein
MRSRLAFALAPVALLVGACSGAGTESRTTSPESGRSVTPQEFGAPNPSPDAIFVINYDPAKYDAAAADSVLKACSQLPGAALSDQADSLPPIQTVVFTGATAGREAVEDCLRRIPGATVTLR